MLYELLVIQFLSPISVQCRLRERVSMIHKLLSKQFLSLTFVQCRW